MKTAEIREAFLNYFGEKGHTRVDSAGLVPSGDNTLLFTNAGMVPFKDVFLGAEKRQYVRATSCQKCLRISGKHNDLENVGQTARHHTFFEMLGNFSFGDYFKEDAISFAWEFVTQVLKLPPERLWVTVYEKDDEARKLWEEKTSIDPKRILGNGEKDNFWSMGPTGPCGPCTEIFYFLGPDDYDQKGEELLADNPLYVEIWNVVFMQFNRSVDGSMAPLPSPSVDTGMGLERVAAVVQGFKANYDSDLLKGIIDDISKLSGKKYDGSRYEVGSDVADESYTEDMAHRVIADHARAVSFLITEGVLPGSEGRNYVLRRLIRRACRHGRNLGFDKPFLFEVVPSVVRMMGDAYPELVKNQSKIQDVIKQEEERFLKTFDSGYALLQKEIEALQASGSHTLAGDVAFQLHDTYGFPLDLTIDIVQSNYLDGTALRVDELGFERAMNEQRERSRAAREGNNTLAVDRLVTKPFGTEFIGYDTIESEAKVVALFDETGQIQEAREGTDVVVLTDASPFYAESGGQVGDSGVISSGGLVLEVLDTKKVAGDTIAHIAHVQTGEIKIGERVRLEVDQFRRAAIRVHHSATHILHLGLRSILGDSVKQAGSRVSDVSLRFDFTYGKSLSHKQLEEIERFVNAYLLNNFPCNTHILPIEEAKKLNAVALFGEKYGDVVRVVELGGNSIEFCGGTHVGALGEVGQFSLLGETSVSAGVRRIEAVAGLRAYEHMRSVKNAAEEVSSLTQSPISGISRKVEDILKKNQTLQKEAGKQATKSLSNISSDLSSQIQKSPGGVPYVAAVLDNIAASDLRSVADDLRARTSSLCVIIGSVVEEKPQLLVALTSDLAKSYHAGNIVKEAAQNLGGKGGGKPDLAQAGGGDASKLKEVVESIASQM